MILYLIILGSVGPASVPPAEPLLEYDENDYNNDEYE